MKNELLFNQLKVDKATKLDWEAILGLLKETGLAFWLSGRENYRNYFIVKIKKKIIACFALDLNKKAGILKSFAISKKLQGKGIGKMIVSKILKIAKELGLNKLYASSWEAANFWKKMNFKEIKLNQTKNSYFLKYVRYLNKNFPRFKNKTKHFLLIVNP